MLRTILTFLCLGSILLISSPVLAADGAATFKTKCAMCHGPDGSGQTPMGKKLGIRALGSADVQKQTDAELGAIITKGKEKMPSYDGKISAEEISGLVKFIRTLKK